MQVLASLDLIRVLGDKPQNALALLIQRTGVDFTRDEETCLTHLQNRPANLVLTEEQVSAALSYTTISQTPAIQNPSVLVAALRRILPPGFSWQSVVTYFDQRDVRLSSDQFLRLYKALLPIAQDDKASDFDIQFLWGGSHWENPETQLAFICAFASLTPEELDASTIPNLQPTFTLQEYQQSPPDVQERAAVAVKHPLVSVEALSAIFQVALHSLHASQSTEAKRLFQEVVVPNLDIFIVSAFGVPKPWPLMAVDTLVSLFDQFLHRSSEHHTFVMDSLWRKDRDWVKSRLIDAHALKPLDLQLIFEHVTKHGWLDELVYLPNGFGFDLAALAHAENRLDLSEWARNNADKGTELARPLLQFLLIKGNMESAYQRPPEGQPQQKNSTTLQVKTVAALLQILEDFMPKAPVQELIVVQRACIIVYPRLINYGEGYDDVIDANGRNGNHLPPQANARMEEHYKTMYGNEVQVKDIVETLKRYKHSRDPLDQDIFACMIHGLFDEYSHYVDYPLEALATTAVLFGGIISHKLIADLPLKIGLGMILEAVRDHPPEASMYKFGLQALMQLFPRFGEWPGFCKQLTQIKGLQGTEAMRKAHEVVRDHEEELSHGGANGTDGFTGEANLPNGSGEEGSGGEAHAAPFNAINVERGPPGAVFEDPSEDIQDKIQFGLNNLTPAKLLTTFREIQERLEERHHQWFASHLVEERAKMQPNFHEVYLDFVRLFHSKGLSAEVLRQTYISTARMLNSESTMQNSTERTHLKHLGAWLGLLTIARDQPIKHRNIAFKQLLIEAHDTKRLIVVIPFVCKVLIQGARSSVYRPPNPWLMDILHLLIELYHHAELKLNLKFEIEVLCKDLNLDHKSIEPSQELLNRAPVEEVGELVVPEGLEAFENMSLNGIGNPVSAGLSPHPLPAVTIPDITSQVQVPPVSEMVVSTHRLHEIVRTALTRALQDIIQPVVDRSVTIAAISTQQMIHKDFATEPDENRIRTSAVTMVKATAGSLALVTSKEPLRANITNYLRNLAGELPQGLPEGTIIMCVNLNLDFACSIIEKQAEERAIPEIEEMLEGELEARRQHRRSRPNEPYVDQALSRWSMTIPNPYKLSPNMGGLNPEQMAIYEEFARQPRAAAPASTPAHAASTSDATRSIANEVLQDQYNAVPNLPTPAETPSLPQLQTQLQYPQVRQGMTNGRPAAPPNQMDSRIYAERVSNLLGELQRYAAAAPEEHWADLPHSHNVLECVDALTQVIIRSSANSSEDYAFYAAEKICQLLFERVDQGSTLFLESLVHVLQLVLKISASSGAGTALLDRVHAMFQQQQTENYFNLPLISALLRTEFLNLRVIDVALSSALAKREEGSLEFFEKLLDLTLLNTKPVALYADFVLSLQGAWVWMMEDPSLESGQRLKAKLLRSGLPHPANPDNAAHDQDQYEYLFDEWLSLIGNNNAPDKALVNFARQLRSRGAIVTKEHFVAFLRHAIDMSVSQHEQALLTGAEGFTAVDGLVRLVSVFARENILEEEDPARGTQNLMVSALAVATLVLNHHHITRGEHFNQRVFFRFFSMSLHAAVEVFDPAAPGSVIGLDGLETHRREYILRFSEVLQQLTPRRFPGFAYCWLDLVLHRRFLPDLMSIEDKRGWAPLMKIMVTMVRYVGDHLKLVDVHDVVKEFVRACVKFFVVIQHDFPEFLAANHVQLCANMPPHAAQLRNIVLSASPRQEPGEVQDPAALLGDYEVVATHLQESGLLELVDQLLQNGPTEDAIAHLTHAINRSDKGTVVFGNVELSTDVSLINAVVLYIGTFAVRRFQPDASVFVSGAPDIATLSLLAHELGPEARYFLLSSIVDELRFPNPFTNYFSSVLLELWGHDINDPEETDIRQQLVRIILERFSGYWPQPWGLMFMIVELTKNEKYMFFDQPFIKADREVRHLLQQIYRANADVA